MADILGTDGNDVLTGTAGVDRLEGLAGDDMLEGGPDADLIFGGAGRDTIVYSRSETGIGVSLGSPNGQGANNPTGAPFKPGDAFGDKLSGIENVIGSGHVDVISGDGYDNTLTGGAGGDFIYGGQGNDTADYSGSSAVDVDLARFINIVNMSSQFGGDAEGDRLGAIENVNGSDENDRIAGNSGVNRLDGKGGDDILEGRGSGDFLIGGSGFDTASYQFASGPVDIRLHNPTQLGGTDSHGDRLVSVEGLVGSAHNDFLSGDMANNIFRGGAGADLIDGGWGRDRASYASSSAAVDVDLTRTGGQIGGDAAGDVLRAIEKLTGSDHGDRLAGDAMDNEFSGGPGADIIDGRGGADFVDYRGSTGIDVDLGRAIQIGGHAEGDQLYSIEGIRGSLYDDRLVGAAGDDHLIGDNGNDYLDGGDGDDKMWGGADADRFYFSAGHDVVTDFNGDAGDRIVITAQFQHPGNDTFTTLMDSAQEVAEGLRLFGATPDDTLLLVGLSKADLNAADVEYLA